MNRLPATTILLLLAPGLATALAGDAEPSDMRPVESPRDATYFIDGEAVTLRNGHAERPALPGSATVVQTQVVGAPAYGDIDGDGDSDALLFLSHESGGSGTFYYVALARAVEGGYRGGETVLIGDRIAPRRLDVRHGLVVVDYLDRAPDESMAVKPTVARTAHLVLRDDGLRLLARPDAGEQRVEGRFTFGHEVRAFGPCSEPEPYWLMGDAPAQDALPTSDREAVACADRNRPLQRALAGNPDEPADQSSPDGHALWLGQRILAIAAALRSPERPGAMDSVLALGLDSRYYVLVRGWLTMQLAGDLSIMDARNGDVSPQLAARIAFLREAIRAIDLE